MFSLKCLLKCEVFLDDDDFECFDFIDVIIGLLDFLYFGKDVMLRFENYVLWFDLLLWSSKKRKSSEIIRELFIGGDDDDLFLDVY